MICSHTLPGGFLEVQVPPQKGLLTYLPSCGGTGRNYSGNALVFPLVVIGRDFWDGLFDFLGEAMVGQGTIDASDLERFEITDSPPEAVRYILRETTQNHGLRNVRRPRRWLEEQRERSKETARPRGEGAEAD